MKTQDGETVAHRICPFCEACCGLTLTIAGGRVTAIRGDDVDVFSGGYMCPKGTALKDLHEDPDRLTMPLIKRGGSFVQADWDDAFAEIERNLPPILARYGRHAVAMVTGTPTFHNLALLLYFPRLAKVLGTHNLYSSNTLDQMPKLLSAGLMFGGWLSIPVPDIERSDFLLILGANPIVSNGSLWTVPDFRGKARALQARGGRIVVVDPRRTETAARADRHLFIRPAADVFFLLGLVHTLFDEGLVRLGRLAEHVTGVETLEAVVAAFAPEQVAGRCGIAAATIRDLARTLAATERAVVYGRLGTCTQEYGTLSSWLVDVVNVLTGHLDEPGGAMFPKAAAFAANTLGKSGIGRGVVTSRRTSRVAAAPEVLGEFPVTCLAEEIETPGDGQVKALIAIAANPVLSSPNGPRLAGALERLDFMVSLDFYLNETSRHADVILPGASPLEHAHYDAAFAQLSYRNHARYSAPVLAPAPGHPADWETLLRLAAIVDGKGAKVDLAQLDDEALATEVGRLAGAQAEAVLQALSRWQGPERLLDLALRSGPYGDQFGRVPGALTLEKVKATPQGIDLGALSARVPEILRTPSGKIELAPSMLVEDLKRPAADVARREPNLVIIGRRQLRSNNSWMHNLPVLAKGRFRCTALVAPADAERLGLRHGGKARITSGGRAIEAEVEISEDMMPGVVSLPHGWGHDLPGARLTVAAERPGANLNALLDEHRRDPLSGNAVLTGTPIEMTPL